MLPMAEVGDILEVRCSRPKFGARRKHRSSMITWYDESDIANLADIQGADFHVPNRDLLLYCYDLIIFL